MEIIPFAESVLQMLGRLWATADDQSLFKVTALGVVSSLAEAVGEQSSAIQTELCALISFGVNPAASDYAFLHEEAIVLWRTTVRFATHLTPSLTALLPFLVHLLQAGTDTLSSALKLLEGYCLLDASSVLSSYALPFFAAFESILGSDLKEESVKLILHTLNMLVLLAPPAIWHPPLEASHCFIKLVLPFHFDESALIRLKYLGSLSRIVLADSPCFHALVGSSAARLSTSPAELLAVLLDAWVNLVRHFLWGSWRTQAQNSTTTSEAPVIASWPLWPSPTFASPAIR
jgi:hypothetical protein